MDNDKGLNKRIYFSKEDDLALAREVAGQNPLDDPARWSIIQVNLLQMIGKSVSVRTLKDRMRNMIKKFQLKEKKNVFKSGTEEEVDELDDLLRCISEIMDEAKVTCLKQNGQNSYQKGFVLRENASLSSSTHTSVKETGDDIETIFNLPDNVQQEIEIEENRSSKKPLLPSEEPIRAKDDSIPKRRKLHQNYVLTPTRKRSAGLKSTTLSFLQKK